MSTCLSVIMTIINYIAYLNIFIWLLIPIRQYNTRFFPFFLVLGILDTISLSFFYLFNINLTITYLFGTNVLLYAALFDLGKKKKFTLVLFFIIVSFFIVSFSIKESWIIQFIIHFIILITFLKILIIYFGNTRKLLLFYLVLIGYEVSLLLKFFVYYKEVSIGPVYFYVTTALEILIGLFFIFINEKNSPAIKV